MTPRRDASLFADDQKILQHFSLLLGGYDEEGGSSNVQSHPIQLHPSKPQHRKKTLNMSESVCCWTARRVCCGWANQMRIIRRKRRKRGLRDGEIKSSIQQNAIKAFAPSFTSFLYNISHLSHIRHSKEEDFDVGGVRVYIFSRAVGLLLQCPGYSPALHFPSLCSLCCIINPYN